MIRSNLKLTQMKLLGKYAAHELLFRDDPAVTCSKAEMHENEAPGRDIRIGVDGLWRNLEDSEGWTIDAGPIVHRGTFKNFLEVINALINCF